MKRNTIRLVHQSIDYTFLGYRSQVGTQTYQACLPRIVSMTDNTRKLKFWYQYVNKSRR